MIKRDEYGRPAHLPLGMRHWPEWQMHGSVIELYEHGFAGAFYDPEADERLTELMGDKPTFADWAGADTGLAESGVGELAMLYEYRMALDKNAYRTAQKRGDCVSFGFANACDAVRAVEILVEGQPESWVAPAATEWMYWGRGHSGEGASCSTIGEFISSKAGMLFRQNYPELGLDFTTYNARLGQDGRSGPPKKAIEVSREYPMRRLTRIKSLEEARDAICNGFALACCSGLSWSNVRDERGVSKRTAKGWAHCMAWDGCDARPETVAKYGGPLFKVAQSWGRWNSGGWAEEYGECPTGGFWILPGDARSAIGHNGTFAVADAAGFRAQSLPHLGAGGRL